MVYCADKEGSWRVKGCYHDLNNRVTAIDPFAILQRKFSKKNKRLFSLWHWDGIFLFLFLSPFLFLFPFFPFLPLLFFFLFISKREQKKERRKRKRLYFICVLVFLWGFRDSSLHALPVTSLWVPLASYYMFTCDLFCYPMSPRSF